MIFQITGASDDLIEIEGDIREEFNVIKDGPYMGFIDIGGKARIHAIYDGCWSFAVGLVDEDIPIPKDWIIQFLKETDTTYSTGVKIITPEKVRVLFQKEES